MAFDRLQALGEPRWTLIRNELLRGEPAMALARKIQQDWNEFQDVAEKTLTQQLNRLRMQIEKGAFGPAVTQKLEDSTPKQREQVLESFGSLNALQTMENLIKIQVKRIRRLAEREQDMPMPIPNLTGMITDGAKMVESLQKMRFDLGLDEFHGVVPGFRGTAAQMTLPDGTVLQKQVYEAAGLMNDIFDQRGITVTKNGNH
jgi:hypothetical protein